MGEENTTTGQVFVSYVRDDSLRVDRLCQILSRAGFPVWRDTASLWPGEDWRAKIGAAIRGNALVFLACFSQQSISRVRNYQNEELILAVEDSLGNVGFWNVTGRKAASLAENDGGAALAFSPDGQLLAIGGRNGTIVFLRQNLTELTLRHFMQLICRKVRHNMTRAQWAEYAPGQPYHRTCS